MSVIRAIWLLHVCTATADNCTVVNDNFLLFCGGNSIKKFGLQVIQRR